MRRLVPAPLLSVALLLAWLLLNGTVHPSHLALGALLAILIPLWSERLRTDRPRLRNPRAAARLALVVLRDIVVSNVQLARRILGPESAISPGYVWVPLSLSNPTAIAVLAGIVTMTPGTLSAEVSPDRRHLLIHAFDATDPQGLVREVKRRYEAPLQEIFE